MKNDCVVSFNDRWSVHSESDTSAQAFVGLLRRAAEYIESLGPVVVHEIVLSRDADGLVLTASFDRTGMPADLDYLDPRMAAQFDDGDVERDDFDFVIALAAELDASTIVDLGCGTGRLATLELISVRDDRVRVDGHVTFDGGEAIVTGSEYRFRTLDQLAESLTRASLIVERTYGNWHSSPLTTNSPDIVIVARTRSEPPQHT